LPKLFQPAPWMLAGVAETATLIEAEPTRRRGRLPAGPQDQQETLRCPSA
jgi:hypothetical protein